MNYLIKWILKDAKWWQFWLPDSGFFGGVIMGAVIFACLYLFGFFNIS